MDKKIKRWIYGFVLIPFALLLVLFNGMIWSFLYRNHQASLRGVCLATKNNLDTLLATQTVRLQNIGLLPNIDALLASNERIRRNAMPQRRDQIEAIKERWASLSRDDFEVREVLDNSVGEMFQKICASDDETLAMFVTDADGLTVAASAKPKRYSFGDEQWWEYAHTKDQTQPVSDGLLSNGVMGLALALRNPQRTNFVSGVLRAELAVDEVTSWLKSTHDLQGSQVVLASTSFSYAIYCEDTISNSAALIGQIVRKPPKPWGWKKGYRYSAVPLEAGIRWTNPVYVLALRPEFIVPWSLAGTMGLTLLLSLLAFVGVRRLAFETGYRVFYKDNMALLEAGRWALGHCRQESAAASATQTASATHNVAMLKELDQWLDSLTKRPESGEAQRHNELQRDLARAVDFQRAYMEKAYPRVPLVHVEGHLRLSFGHRYLPALALGGDFFDVFASAPDCAGIFIADVMGQGARSALITTILRTLIFDLSRQSRNARFFLSELNKAFYQALKTIPEPLFVSAFYLVADVTSRAATYSSAGHPAPFLLRRSSRRIERLETAEPRGMALGLVDSEDFTGGQCRLIDGDCFLFFTDGLYEARNSRGEAFGLERLRLTLEGLLCYPQDKILDGVLQAVKDFTGSEKFADDVCLVAADVSSKAEPA